MPKNLVEMFVYGTIALAILFLLFSTIIMPQFSSSYRYAQALCWDNTTANCDYSPVTNLTEVLVGTNCTGQMEDSSNTAWCQRVLTAGDYRATNQGIVLLVLVIALIGFGVMFISRIRKV